MRTIFYDTETTGIRAGSDRVVEIAAYDSERDCSFVRLINPGCPIPPEASAIHKITDEMVAEAPAFSQILEEFLDFCEGEVMLVAHNNDAFDIHFLRHEFSLCEAKLPSHWRFFDTLKWARKYRPDLPRHSLQYLREIYGFQANNAHRALDDVIILHQVYQAMVMDLSNQEVYDLLHATSTLTRMPFGKHQNKPLSEVPKDYLEWLQKNGAFDKPENQELKEALETLGLLSLACT